MITKNTLKVGQKVKFDAEKYFMWTVRAVRGKFAILTSSRHYTIVDTERNIRGTDNYGGVGYETDEQIERAMNRLHEPNEMHGIEISRRNCVPLVISGVK